MLRPFFQTGISSAPNAAAGCEKKKVTEEKEEGYYRSERCYGKFYRSIPLPKGAKADAIKAELTNGILKVMIPVPEVKPMLREVPITATK